MQGKGILLIHGLTGTPHEFRSVDAALGAAGYQTRLVTLPGHGDTPDRRLEDTSALEILDHVAAEYHRFAAEVDELYIVGHSLGGICTLLTAAVRPPKLQGAVVFSAPYEHAYFYNYLHGLGRLPVSHLVKGLCFVPQGCIKARRPVCPPWRVPRLLEQSRIIFGLMKENIHQIDVPVSLAHSVYDLTIPYTEMHKLAAKIRPGLVKTTTLTRSGHRIFPHSADVTEANRVIFDFVERDCRMLATGEGMSLDSLISA